MLIKVRILHSIIAPGSRGLKGKCAIFHVDIQSVFLIYAVLDSLVFAILKYMYSI